MPNQLLLTSPIKGKTVIGFDPAYRTGCKIAVIDETGKVLDTTTVYPTEPQNDVEGAKKELTKLIAKYNVDMICNWKWNGLKGIRAICI